MLLTSINNIDIRYETGMISILILPSQLNSVQFCWKQHRSYTLCDSARFRICFQCTRQNSNKADNKTLYITINIIIRLDFMPLPGMHTSIFGKCQNVVLDCVSHSLIMMVITPKICPGNLVLDVKITTPLIEFIKMKKTSGKSRMSSQVRDKTVHCKNR